MAAATTSTAARISTSSTRPAPTASRPTAAASTHSMARSLAFVVARLREIDGVDNGVGTLGGLDRALQVSLAATVDAVRENNESLSTLLFFHQFIRRQKNGVVKLRTAAMMRA